MSDVSAPGPLAGVKVVELGVWVAGPAAAGLMADWGADVIKVEPPGGSTLITSAPQSAISPAAAGPATHTPSSTTFTPARGPAAEVALMSGGPAWWPRHRCRG